MRDVRRLAERLRQLERPGQPTRWQFDGFVNAINGISLSESYAVLSPNGRSVLFQRRQTAVAGGEADCFFWDGNTRASAAQGAGCLDVRNTQSEVQSAVNCQDPVPA